MTHYRIRDLLLLPNLLSGSRIPLAVAFPLVARSVRSSFIVLGFAGLTDILDGFAARNLGQTTPLGALLDGVTDKIFAASVLGTLVATGSCSPGAALLLATRELGELPLALRVLKSSADVADENRGANALGKLATVLEFTSVIALIAHLRSRSILVGATALVGAAAAASYWLRELRRGRQRRGAHRLPFVTSPPRHPAHSLVVSAA